MLTEAERERLEAQFAATKQTAIKAAITVLSLGMNTYGPYGETVVKIGDWAAIKAALAILGEVDKSLESEWKDAQHASDDLWLVLQWVSNPSRVEIVGVFTEKGLAVNACRDENYLVMPIKANTQAPHETTDTPVFYPLRKAAENVSA